MPSLMESFWLDGAAGLPIHPLVVHFVVVLVPLAALGLVVQVAVPRLRERYLGLTLVLLAGGVVAAFLAEKSGEGLAEREGFPDPHALLGHFVPWVSLALLVVATVWWWLLRRAEAPWSRTLAVLVVVVALAAAGLGVVVGHSGAEAHWG